MAQAGPRGSAGSTVAAEIGVLSRGWLAAVCSDALVAAMAAPGATIRCVRDQGSCAGAEESSVISVSAWWSPGVFDMETRRARRAGSACVIALHLLGCRRIAGLSHVSRGLGSPVFDMEPASTWTVCGQA